MATKIDTGVASDGERTVDGVNEGQKLRQLLESTRYSHADLARAAGVTRAAVYRWVTTERFPDRMWATISLGLRKLNINTTELRPESVGMGVAQEDLVPLVSDWDDAQLLTLRRILKSDLPSRERLLAFLDGALRRSR